ncbi:hypothetical protein PC116_g18857 [Phytophthora cactorum]|uniref:Uncharacterized protein n=1 Tax=Phytophthora cactorum TaxID=29920 RepID=A0A8T1CHZ8_9STRA|nr:hypothetical protein PC111_g20986 [Phytophthora cactorum]KAG2852231.1 hypothetical protein PC113_g15192 [Phytophthora cactorum]KAG2885511.1 hypothetical protein PC115_g20988 [Phytophthora cactorum]KAG2892628.1 hypothetical protein PC114_g16566 [Phytophthora cactorum]KAG2923857.1 hypothetical protein PC117_g15574 [Phytophthora cactorum]
MGVNLGAVWWACSLEGETVNEAALCCQFLPRVEPSTS